ncbi:hypothetical protein C2W64_01577 [Brevibacillus laterosporus]|nr:hypothetical protein [Brevibacillus laterosporus]RAP30385.1 hypothetical protein C2W64_01577 [Brevibacillus laterosporus]
MFFNGKPSINQNGNVQLKGELLYKNEGKQPKELTLTFDKAGKENSNVQWEVPIHLEK